MSISYLITILSHLPIYVTTVYAVIVYKELQQELKIFSWLLFVSGLIQFISLILALNRINNMPLLHLYVAAGFTLMAMFYSAVLSGFIDAKIIWITTIVFTVYTIINSAFFEGIFTFNSHALTVESVLVIIFSISTYMLFLTDDIKESKKHILSSLNWINSGIFIYYLSNLLIFYFGRIIIGSFSRQLNLDTWVLHSFFSVVMYFCFFVGLWKRPRT
jgi:hypothetical protein